MKIALAQLNYTIGDFETNKVKIIESITRARHEGVELLLFAEQAISGCPAFDLLNKVTFLERAEEALVEIASYCDGISVLVGLPLAHNNKTVSVTALIRNRRVIKYIGKKNIRSRLERWFLASSKGCETITVGNSKVAVVMGDDIYDVREFDKDVELIVSVAAIPYCRRVIEKRYDYLKRLSFTAGKSVAFVNQIGGSTDIVYDGSSAVFNSCGEAIALLKSFEEDFAVVDTVSGQPMEVPYQYKTVNVYKAMKLGLKDYFEKNGFTRACLGMSGGIDSALVLAIAAEVLGPENVEILMMPSQFSSDHSVEDAVKMAEKLGVEYHVTPITEIYKSVNDALKPVFGPCRFDVTEENIQSRIRMTLLMALANKKGCILLNTSNKSENAVGYGTLYADSAGAISITGDLYKIEIYSVARHINRHEEIIPECIIEKEPSAELRPEQKDSDSLPPYDMLDAILYRMIEEGQHREEIINAGFDAATVYKVYNMVKANEYKRSQHCPVLRLSTRTFKRGRVMPLTNKYGF